MRKLVDVAMIIASLALIAAATRPGGPVAVALSDWRAETRLANQRAGIWDSLLTSPLVLGNPMAEFTVVEFSDYECPYCRQVHSAVAQFLSSTDTVRLIVLNLPLPQHKLAQAAARAAICADAQGRFAAMHSRLMTSEKWRSDSNFAREAALAGIRDGAAFARCRVDSVTTLRLERDLHFASVLSVRATPTFLGQHGEEWRFDPVDRRFIP